MNLSLILFARALPKRGHLLRRLKIRIMNSEWEVNKFAHVPLGFFIASMIAMAIFTVACCSIFVRLYH